MSTEGRHVEPTRGGLGIAGDAVAFEQLHAPGDLRVETAAQGAIAPLVCGAVIRQSVFCREYAHIERAEFRSLVRDRKLKVVVDPDFRAHAPVCACLVVACRPWAS